MIFHGRRWSWSSFIWIKLFNSENNDVKTLYLISITLYFFEKLYLYYTMYEIEIRRIMRNTSNCKKYFIQRRMGHLYILKC